MEAVWGRASTRFLVVSLLPAALFFGFVATLLAAGAPRQSPSLQRALVVYHTLQVRDLILVVVLVLVVSVVMHPIQYPLIQMLEGYWEHLPYGHAASAVMRGRYIELRYQLREEERGNESDDAVVLRIAASATERLAWLPDREEKVLPTALGNALRAGEERAASRYGLNIRIVMPRLSQALPPGALEGLKDRRNQLDATARMAAYSLLAVPVSMALLVPTGAWLYVPALVLGLGWLCYRSAVAAARGFCTDLAAVVDLHHLNFWRSLSLAAPPDLAAEKQSAEVLMTFLQGDEIDDENAEALRWITHHPQQP